MENIFPERMRQLRNGMRLSMSQLAERIGVIKQTVGHYETGKALPSYGVLIKLAEVFGCSLDHLTGLDDRPPAVRPEPPAWLAELMPDLEKLNPSGREAVRALVAGLRKR
jgi:transcriptional regulator with XRE-family HTH domain